MAIEQGFRENCLTQQRDQDGREDVREQLQRWSNERHGYLCMPLCEAGLGEHDCTTREHTWVAPPTQSLSWWDSIAAHQTKYWLALVHSASTCQQEACMLSIM